ncbi:MAG: serine/threonine protein kinase [Myxococcales bacterium]|nr:serine/threonine protein kinase [Myxococcales bacterium]MCB9576444.1 serine/threonine protein kinase [Polyangiaceae bacterium]
MKTTFGLLFLLLATGCGNSFVAATPPGFVELPDQERYDYRATTADGLVIAVREIDNDPKGTLDFWTRAIENRMRQRGGYALLSQADVKTKAGLAGKQLRFGHDEGGSPHLYTVTVFLTDSTIYLLESGGTKALMEKNAEQLEWAVQNFQVK